MNYLQMCTTTRIFVLRVQFMLHDESDDTCSTVYHVQLYIRRIELQGETFITIIKDTNMAAAL